MVHELSTTELLEAWDRGYRQGPVLRALVLLSAAYPESVSELAALTLGERNRRLLTLHERTFGDAIEATVSCPECDETVELEARVSSLLEARPAGAPKLHASWSGGAVSWRLPTSLDVIETAAAGYGDRLDRRLLERCVVGSAETGADLAWGLPDEVVREIAEAMDAAEPQSDVRLGVACPACGTTWSAELDIAAFVWEETRFWAERTLYDIHRLAAAHGWSERELIEMSSQRRQLYLEMIL